MEVPFRKIPYWFTMCVVELVSCGCKCSSFAEIRADDADMPVCCANRTNSFLFRVASNLALILSSSSSARVFYVLFFCLDLILLLQTFPRFLKLLSCLHVVVRKLSSEFMTFILGSVFSVYTAETRDVVTIPTENED